MILLFNVTKFGQFDWLSVCVFVFFFVYFVSIGRQMWVIHSSAAMSSGLVQTRKSKVYFGLDDKRKPLGQLCTFKVDFFSYEQLVTSISTEIQRSISKKSLPATIVYYKNSRRRTPVEIKTTKQVIEAISEYPSEDIELGVDLTIVANQVNKINSSGLLGE